MPKFDHTDPSSNPSHLDTERRLPATRPLEASRLHTYRELLADTSFDEVQRDEFLCTLWNILICMWGCGYDFRTFADDDID